MDALSISRSRTLPRAYLRPCLECRPTWSETKQLYKTSLIETKIIIKNFILQKKKKNEEKSFIIQNVSLYSLAPTRRDLRSTIEFVKIIQLL